jgi:transposase-like protein
VLGASPPTNPIFTDERTARAALEALRWPDGPACPKSTCGATGPAVAKIGGVKQSHRDGLYRCKTCRGQFTVTVGTIFERSKVPLNDWLWALQLLSYQHPTIRELQVELDVTYKTALQIWKRVCAVLRTYRGHNKGFGTKVTAFISSKRPQSELGMATWRAKSKKLLNGENGVPRVTGLLSTSAGSRGPAENLERTERLLRLLLAAVPKPSKSAKKKAAKLRRLERGTVTAITPLL